jgi:hypothetical protein
MHIWAMTWDTACWHVGNAVRALTHSALPRWPCGHLQHPRALTRCLAHFLIRAGERQSAPEGGALAGSAL